MIAPDPQAPRRNLRRQMAVAEMPCDSHQMLRIVAANFGQRLGCCHHFDQPVVIKHQRITAAQHDGVLQIEQEFQPARSGHRHPPPVAIVEIEHDSIGRRLGPAVLRANLGRADHADTIMQWSFSAVVAIIGHRPFQA